MIKVIITTIITTFIVTAFVASIFLNSILGVFGLATTTIDSLNTLQESKQIIDKLKTRHEAKKLNVSKRFVKRSSKKIAMSAASAATIGTAAVVVTVAVLEVYDYCDDKKEIHEDENILFKTDNEFDYNQCLNDAIKDSDEIMVSVKNTVPEVVDSAWNSTKGTSRETWESTKATIASAWGSTTDSTERIWDSLINWVK